MDYILSLLDALADTSKATEKKRLLMEFDGDVALLKRVLHAAYNPFIQYHVSKDTAQQYLSDCTQRYRSPPCAETMFSLLDDLSARRVTGNDALESIQNKSKYFGEAIATVFLRILGKDLRCGVGAKTINSVFKGLIPQFELMLASKYDASKWNSFPCFVEPKLDGIRVVAVCDAEHEVEIYSRGGKPLPALDFIKSQIASLQKAYFKGQDVMFDGEVLGESFNHTVSIARKRDVDATGAVFHIFDLVTAPAGKTIQDVMVQGARDVAYETRRSKLEAARNVVNHSPNLALVDPVFASNEEDIANAYAEFRSQGLEGAVVKAASGRYEFKRSKGWQKIKGEETYDLEVVDILEGTGKYEGMLGAVVVDFNGVNVRVGSGFSDEDRKELGESIIGKVVEVEAHEVTPDGSLRHPRFVRIREDKS